MENELNILVFSDLNWQAHLRSLKLDEIQGLTANDLQQDRYERIKRYYQTIIESKADLVIFAGDVTGDGFCGHGFHLAFFTLLKFLEEKGIYCLFISGNHDPDEFYQTLLKLVQNFNFVKEISGKIISIKGLKFQGLNYDCSKSKRALKKVIAEQTEKVDVLVAHSQIKRRIKHFDIPCDYIFTGHYDRKLLAHRGKVFLALDNDSEEFSYAHLRKQKGQEDEISIHIKHSPEHTFSFKEKVKDLLEGNRNSILCINDQPSYDLIKFENASDASLSRDGDHFLYLKYLRGINYTNSLDTMFKIANNVPLNISDLSLNQIHGLAITASYKISESMIEDYLGNVIN